MAILFSRWTIMMDKFARLHYIMKLATTRRPLNKRKSISNLKNQKRLPRLMLTKRLPLTTQPTT